MNLLATLGLFPIEFPQNFKACGNMSWILIFKFVDLNKSLDRLYPS